MSGTAPAARADAARTVDDAYRVAAGTPDPELPMLTIEDLGILRSVERVPSRGATPGGRAPAGGARDEGVVVTITPTYSGCPAMREISADVAARLRRAGFGNVCVATQLSPPWSSDWITGDGRRKLAAAGIAPPSPAPAHRTDGHREGGRTGPVPLTLTAPPSPDCPRCGATDTVRTAAFSATACKSLYRCTACGEPFEGIKAL
jgi:ring-1,2-phenylacetyl-CoA epoxidase subunit PaaD